jgi:uncharacterized SAM-binding protein YcdF (DUF218 family)
VSERALDGPAPPVVCVLGCRVGSAAFGRRARAAAEAYRGRGAELAVACGGRAWSGRVEADELAGLMSREGVPVEAIVRERCSLDTRDNARFAASMLFRRGISRVLLVTCTWHLPRAARLFQAAGLEVEGLGVEPESATLRQRLYRTCRERLSGWSDARRPMRIV